MKTISEVLVEYEERGHVLKAGLILTDGKRTWTLEHTNGDNDQLALRMKEVAGHYIGYESIEYTIVPNLRIAPIKITVYKMVYQIRDCKPEVTTDFYPTVETFKRDIGYPQLSITWVQRLDRCSKVIEVEC